MVFHNHKTIFYHIPKTAGVSIEKFLDTEKTRDPLIFYPDVIYGLYNRLYSQHYNHEMMLPLIDKHVLNSYFKFTFVRNTYDRLVSAFSYLPIPKSSKTPEGFKLHMEKICNKMKENKIGITEHFNTQMNYIFYKGEKTVDFVGRYENLDKDFEIVCHLIGIPYSPLEHLNKSDRKNYQYYYDKKTIDLVKNTYKDEIEYFEYEF